MSKVVLIDGHSILNRAFYGVPELTNSKGLHTNAVYGFLNIMFRVIEDARYPMPVIIPYCLTGEVDEVTKDNLGTDVQLYLHERRTD